MEFQASDVHAQYASRSQTQSFQQVMLVVRHACLPLVVVLQQGTVICSSRLRKEFVPIFQAAFVCARPCSMAGPRDHLLQVCGL